MEFPEIGKHCDHPDCKQLEFLPIKCKCNKIFCSQHFNEHIEDCEQRTSNVVEDLKKIETVYKCSFKDCKSTSIVPLICSKCQKHFCIEHRHINECEPVDSNQIAEARRKLLAPIQQFNEAKSLIDKELDKKLATARLKPKSMGTANKVQLMRVKNKATGLKTIPVADRIYFNVRYPSKISDKTAPVFVSKVWAIGRAIDAISQELKITNNNNQMNSLKLRLFHTEQGHIVTTSMSEKMSDLLSENVIVDGQCLTLEYVSDDCICLDY